MTLQDKTQFETLVPLDRLQAEAIALTPQYDAQEVQHVAERLNGLFDMLRQDDSKQFGKVICWAAGLDPEEELEIDAAIQDTAIQQNHGMITRYEKGDHVTQGTLWMGEDTTDGASFYITKQEAPIVFSCGMISDNGLTYGITGSRMMLPDKPNPEDDKCSIISSIQKARDVGEEVVNAALSNGRDLYQKVIKNS